MLYLVATPIGNLGDITFRAAEALRSADVIACEDTRRSLALLNHLEIKKPLLSCHKFNERASGEKILALLREGKTVAVITDAGMPVVSDPGNLLVKMLIEAGEPYTVLPGACACVTALAFGGLDADRFCFLGFLPEKNAEREALLAAYRNVRATLVFYSAPHDVRRDVETLFSCLGERRAVAVRELTKLHEERVEFRFSAGYPKEPRGEFVLLVEGAGSENALNALSPEAHIAHYLSLGLDKKEALKAAAKDRGVKKSDLYRYTVAPRADE